MTSEPQELTLDGLFLPPAGPVKATLWRAVVAAWVTNGPDSGAKSPVSWLSSAPHGSSARTSLAFYRSAGEMTSQPSFKTWPTSGMGSPGGFWTLSTSESPSVVVESSLSDVLEIPGPHLLKYYLSPKACAGILRRAAKRGRALPAALEKALRSVADQLQ